MSFPQTHLTLIERLAASGSQEDWRGFFRDYWGPVCRFALRLGARDLHEAEDIAAQAFETIWRNRLLHRWVTHQAAKLRALLCAVVRRVASNRHRSQSRRARWEAGAAPDVEELEQPAAEAEDAFYAAWVEEVVRQAVELLAAEYCRENQTDRIRVFYGRLCEGLSIAEVSASLNLKTTTVDYYYRDARDRLARTLEELVRPQVERYCRAEEAADEFAREWERLGSSLSTYGGIEEAVRRSYAALPDRPDRGRMGQAIERLTSLGPPLA